MTTLSSQTPLDTTAPNVALAKYVDLGKWEHNNETEYRWQGQLALSQFPRLWALRDPNHDNDQPLQVNLTIEKRGNILHWHLQTDGDFWQTCQRCLEPVATDLYIDSEFALLENESQVALLPEGAEVILLDEIEKAHADVFNVLLQVLDDGRLTDGQGRNVDFKNTLIIMTSNLGSAEIMKKQGQISREDIQSMLMQFFRPEFLNRVDDIVVFKALEKEQINDIVKMILKELGERLEKQLDLTLVCSDEAVAYLADTGFDPAFGARPLKRLIVHTVENLLGRKIVSGEIKSGETVRVVLKNGVIDIEQVS